MLVCVVAVLCGCGGTATPPPTAQPVETPARSVAPASPVSPPKTPEPAWRDISDDELMAACSGTPIEGAAPYAGAVHPLVVYTEPVTGARSEAEHLPSARNDIFYDINERANFLIVRDGRAEAWPGAIQLVVCLRLNKSKRVGSCGLFRSMNGAVNEMTRYESSVTLRVVAAETGKVLQRKVLTQPAPKCKKSYTYISTGNGPWWDVKQVSAKRVNEWATALSSKPAK
jgi:hypothetical protein